MCEGWYCRNCNRRAPEEPIARMTAPLGMVYPVWFFETCPNNNRVVWRDAYAQA